jgi:hypothetical protein
MNRTALFLLLALTGTALCGIASSDFERELKQLTVERDSALAAAQESINAKHLSSLRSLLKRATQTKDSKAAAQISDAIGRITVVGSWSVVCNNGFKTHLDVRPDATVYGTNGNVTAQWAIRGGKFIIINPTNQDIYELPSDNKMSGVTTTGVSMVATRTTK